MGIKPNLDVHERPKLLHWISLSLQHLFAMFGATILVPFLTGLDPAVALISSGVGTITYLIITKGQIPAYLGSSFAFISPIILAKQAGGIQSAMLGAFLVGLVYGIVALVIYKVGFNWIMKILSPVVVGPVIMVIGLGLANTAVGMAMNHPDTGKYSITHFSVALVTLTAVIIATMFFRGFLSLVPILIGIIVGYIFAYAKGLVDFTKVKETPWFAIPDFHIPFVTYSPDFQWGIALALVPIAAVTMTEHIGHQMVLKEVIGRNILEKPGLHRSMLGDGLATMFASLIGGPPATTYGENIGVLAITRVFSVYVLFGAGLIAITFGFVGKIAALISTIPTSVMGGVSILLFGIIASQGIRTMIEHKVDFSEKRNLVITAVILVLGIGGAYLELPGNFQLSGMALATLVGIILNLVLPKQEGGNK